MAIIALGYLGIRSDKLADWASFASRLLGMQVVDQARTQLALRMDDLRQRVIVTGEAGDSLGFMGWQVEDRAGLNALSSRLSDAGIDVEQAGPALTDQRYVRDLRICHDPAGNRIELFCDPMPAERPFVPGRAISGFKTGPLGLGHAVLHVADIQNALPFYRELLGFRVSDYGNAPVPMCFLHVNGRHHSFALIGSGQAGFHHFMVEYTNLDDVGQGFDIASDEKGRVAYTLGRHTNDWMTSFYAHTPSGFFVESGWGGRVIEPETWEPQELSDGPSLWGHDRPYLPDEMRTKYADMRKAAAAKGLQAPPPTDCPWLYGVLTGRVGSH
jgi:2,3-dihydroxybiphenyl 1,2-dioxygenase